MDIVSHGLWGSILFGRRNRKSFWAAFSFGILPDLLVFGVPFAMRILGSLSGDGGGAWGPPERTSIPSYVYQGYNVTHSLVVFAAAFAIVWIARKKPFIPMLAWPAHILLDMPLHTAEFFPTPFLWPISDFHVSGVSWGDPWIFFPNVALLAALYFWHFVIRKRMRRRPAPADAQTN